MTDQSTTGSMPIVVQEQTEAITFRLQDPATGDDLSLDSATLDILDQGGATLFSGESATVSGSIATYSRAWTAAAGFTITRWWEFGWSNNPNDIKDGGAGYRADWSLVSGGTTYKRRMYFQVVRRRFVSQLTDTDLTSLYPYLSGQLTNGLSAHRLNAWREIERRCYQKIKQYPGNVFNPERLFDAHKWLSLAEAHFALAFDATSEDMAKYEIARKRGLDALDQVMSLVDVDEDDDGYMDEADKHRTFAGITLVR